MDEKNYDFSGWATRNDILCTDGRTIRRDAFKHNDGKTVPLVWNHGHNDVENVLGYAVLQNRPEGVYAYGYFNDTEKGQYAKALLQHGDITQLSINANQLRQNGGDVLHGNIKEVSLVIAGANKGANIESVIKHGEESDEEAIIYSGEDISMYHAEDSTKDDDKKESKEDAKTKTVEEIIDSMNPEQKDLLYGLVGMALEEDPEDYADEEDNKDDKEDEAQHSDDIEGGNNTMKKNIFENKEDNIEVSGRELTHADQEAIVKLAKEKNVGSFQSALEIYAEENEIAHAADAVGGFTQSSTGNVTELFPEFKDVRPGMPDLITNDQGWISTVLRKVHKSPISRIRTRHVDIRNIQELRAKGYKKGNQKKLSGNFKLVTRTTDPQTVYVRNSLHRDDIIDITDFDYVQYLYNIDKMMLNEELAMAIMLGDGRDDGAEDKIDPTHIRPIWLDDDLYTLHVDLDIEGAKAELQGTGTGASFGENYITAEAMINTVLYAREKFKGSGTPDFYCTPHMLNVMLLARDMNGRRIYSSVQELATALNVASIQTAEQFEGKERTDSEMQKKKLIGIICNLADYSLGATKGGEITHFTQFDIDFNQQKSLLETRVSGALTRVYSAIAIEEKSKGGF